jgi:hypothetical protein
MSDPKEQEQTQTQEGEGVRDELNNELRQFSTNLERALRSVISSDPARTFQRDISSSMNEIGKQFQTALQSFNDNPDIKKLSDQGQQVMDQIQSVTVMQEFQKALASGVSQLNQQLDTFIVNMQKNREEESSTGSMQSIPIEEDE